MPAKNIDLGLLIHNKTRHVYRHLLREINFKALLSTYVQ